MAVLRNRPTKLDLEVYRGDDVVVSVYVDDGGDPPSPVDISTWDFTAQVRKTVDSDDPLATFTIDVSDAVNGNIVLTLAGAVTEDLPVLPEASRWDLQRTSPTKRTLLAGLYLSDGDVTRP